MRSSFAAEFAEIATTGAAAVDIPGYQIEPGSPVRHTFPATVLQPGWVVVVFGGGIIPSEDIAELKRRGVAEIFTPGARTDDIIAWVRDHVDDPAQAAGPGAA